MRRRCDLRLQYFINEGVVQYLICIREKDGKRLFTFLKRMRRYLEDKDVSPFEAFFVAEMSPVVDMTVQTFASIYHVFNY